MKTVSLSNICKEADLEFVEVISKPRELKDNEYYALVVTDEVNKFNSPHVIGVEESIHRYIVGIERLSSSEPKPYVSKNFHARSNLYRGFTIIVEVNNLKNVVLL